MNEDAEAKNRALRHSIYKEGSATREMVAKGVITIESLKAKGFVPNPATGGWHRPPKDRG